MSILLDSFEELIAPDDADIDKLKESARKRGIFESLFIFLGFVKKPDELNYMFYKGTSVSVAIDMLCSSDLRLKVFQEHYESLAEDYLKAYNDNSVAEEKNSLKAARQECEEWANLYDFFRKRKSRVGMKYMADLYNKYKELDQG